MVFFWTPSPSSVVSADVGGAWGSRQGLDAVGARQKRRSLRCLGAESIKGVVPEEFF